MGRVLSVILLLAAAPVLCAQTIWSGSVSTAWNVAGNWTAGVPTATTPAIIAPAVRNPTTAGIANPTCGALTVLAGATIQVAIGFPLSVNGGPSTSLQRFCHARFAKTITS